MGQRRKISARTAIEAALRESPEGICATKLRKTVQGAYATAKTTFVHTLMRMVDEKELIKTECECETCGKLTTKYRRAA